MTHHLTLARIVMRSWLWLLVIRAQPNTWMKESQWWSSHVEDALTAILLKSSASPVWTKNHSQCSSNWIKIIKDIFVLQCHYSLTCNNQQLLNVQVRNLHEEGFDKRQNCRSRSDCRLLSPAFGNIQIAGWPECFSRSGIWGSENRRWYWWEIIIKLGWLYLFGSASPSSRPPPCCP